MRLTDLACRRAESVDGKPVKLSDDKGLYLLVKTSGRYWRWDYRFGDKRKTMALGVYPEVGLDKARGATYTATRLRELCGQVFRYAIATGRATYDPAADLAGAIVPVKVQHRPAITGKRPFGQFLRNLTAFQGADDLTNIATRLALLTFVRSQELRFAKWDEVDIEARVWRIPAGRLKMAKGSSLGVSGWPRHLEATVVMREHRDHVGDLVGGFGEGHRGVLAMARRRCRCREHSDGAAGRERLCAPPLDGVAVLSRLAATGGATTRRAGCSTAWACA